jgi:glutathione synthase/RimK-type ligase-like ATP-grasp enzyme
VALVWPNRAVFTDRIKGELAERAGTFIHSGISNQTIKLSCDWAINRLADTDEYANSLAALSDAAGDTVRIFNHPNAIAASRRDISSKLLLGIPNLVVPKCVRFVPAKLNDFRQVLSENSMRYPVLVRPARSQSGTGLHKIASDSEMRAYMAVRELGIAYYITEYVDCRRKNAPKPYSKVRLAIVGDEIFFRGFGESDYWNINRAFGNEPSDQDVKKFLFLEQKFEEMTGLQALGKEIASRGGLDFWGVDLGYLGNGKYVLFEANAAMSILKPQGLQPNQQKAVLPLITRIEDALRAHMENPDRWVNPFGTVTPVTIGRQHRADTVKAS